MEAPRYDKENECSSMIKSVALLALCLGPPMMILDTAYCCHDVLLHTAMTYVNEFIVVIVAVER